MNIIKAEAYLDMLKDKAKETDMLAKENLQLKSIISKAIEYIEKVCCNGCDESKQILDILRGEDNELR